MNAPVPIASATRYAFAFALAAAAAAGAATGTPAPARDAVTPFSANAIATPLLGRAALDPGQLQHATIHVPEGTTAYLVGRLDDEQPDLLAWYALASGRLVAAVELAPPSCATEHAPEGVAVEAGTNAGGAAAALVTVTTTDTVQPLLEPPGAVTLESARGAAVVAPLLTFAGSSSLLGMVAPLPAAQLRSASFGVRVADRSGATVFQRNGLRARGALPVNVAVATTTPGKPTDIVITNAGSEPRLVTVQPTGVQWAGGGSEARTVEVPAQSTASPGAVSSPLPGRFPIAYREQPLAAGESGSRRVGLWARGPVPVSATGEAGLALLGPRGEPRLTPQDPQLAVRPAPAAALEVGDSRATAFTLAGLAGAGAVALTLRDPSGQERQETVTFVPLSLSELEETPATVQIVPIAESAALTEVAPEVALLPPLATCTCKAMNLGTFLFGKPAYVGRGATTTVTIDFTIKGKKECTAGTWPHTCDGSVDWSLVGTTSWQSTAGEKLGPAAPLPGETQSDSKGAPTKCSVVSDYEKSFQYSVRLPGARQIVGKVELKLDAVCAGGGATRSVKLVVDSSDPSGYDQGATDFDGDGLDGNQEKKHRTNPLLQDTDGDGFDDGAEVAAGTNPNDRTSHP